MGWSFKLHGALAGLLSAIAALVGALTFLPGGPVLPGSWRVPFVAGFPLLIAATLRIMLTRTDRSTRWLAFRCLPTAAQAALAALALGGAVLTGLSGDHFQNPRIVEGRYYVFDTSHHARSRLEVSRGAYEAAAANEERTFLGVSAGLLAAAAGLALAAGELRRSEALTRQQA